MHSLIGCYLIENANILEASEFINEKIMKRIELKLS